jgi:hypothetical protein
MKKIVIFCYVFLMAFNAGAQKRNYIWCFGDSAGIDFNNLSNPTTFQSGMDCKGSCCSIADTSGSLLFYASTSYRPLYQQGYIKLGAIYNKMHQVMQNGDSIVGIIVYNEVVIIPFPDNDSLYYVFFAGVTPIYGLYYCVVNINANGGNGSVISKNNQLLAFAQVDCLSSIKHGNGRDWWLFFRRSDPNNGFPPNNEFHSYLITPNGISNYSIQHIGSQRSTNGAKLSFSKQGDKIVYSDWRWLIEKYDFNRCTGIISNPVNIQQENTIDFNRAYFSNEISPNGKVLYVSAQVKNDTAYLLQFNLDAANISATRDTIWSQSYPINAAGALKRGPNDKIYFSCAYVTWNSGGYPYPDSMYNMYNMNLGVIHSPDSLGAACNFQPYSFYLGGKRTYWGLPNNPDYDMPAWAGSPCDTILNLSPALSSGEGVPTLMLTYVSEWEKLFVNAQNLKGRNCVLEVFDVMGKVIYTSPPAPLQGRGGYFTHDINCSAFAKGMYLVNLKTEKETLVKKFVKQ